MNIDKFHQMLASHDWTYPYADDYRYWSAGRKQADLIDYELKLHPEWIPLCRFYSDYVYGKIEMKEHEFIAKLNQIKAEIEGQKNDRVA